MASPPNHYATLGVDEKATQADIKRAFRLLALKLHPDSASSSHDDGDEASRDRAKAGWQRVLDAYEIIGDKAKRKEYDIVRRQPPKQPGFGAQGPRWHTRHTAYPGGGRGRGPRAEQRTSPEDEYAARAAWEHEKREAVSYKLQSVLRWQRTEEARQRRVGRTLSKFWQTQPRFTKQDGVFLAVMGAAITLTVMTWTSMAANRKERRV